MCTARYRECRPASISSRSKFHFGVVILDATLDPPRDWTPPPPRHRASCTPFPSRPGKKDARLNVERSNITISNSVSVLRALLYIYIYHGFEVMGVNSTVTENELKNSVQISMRVYVRSCTCEMASSVTKAWTGEHRDHDGQPP